MPLFHLRHRPAFRKPVMPALARATPVFREVPTGATLDPASANSLVSIWRKSLTDGFALANLTKTAEARFPVVLVGYVRVV